MKKKISVVIPCHNEDENLKPLIKEIKKEIPRGIGYEVILIDDGSDDLTARVISQICKKDRNVQGLIFHRNFGHQMVLIAGINKTTGDMVVTMDADFQHPPEYLPQMIKLWEEGYDLVNMKKRDSRKVSILKKTVRQ